MRQQSRIARLLTILAVLPASLSVGFGQQTPAATPQVFLGQPVDLDLPKDVDKKTPYAPSTTTPLMPKVQCAPTNAHGYGDRGCRILINRQKPGSPLPVIVPKNTTVEIRVFNRSYLENIQFVQTTDAVPAPDFGQALVKLFLPGIATITGRDFRTNLYEAYNKRERPASYEGGQQYDIETALAAARDELNDLTKQIGDMKKAEAARLSKLPDSPGTNDPKANTALDDQRQHIFNLLDQVEKIPLPTGELQEVDREITSKIAGCYQIVNVDAQHKCLADAQMLQTRQAELAAAVAKVQAKQAALVALQETIKGLPAAGDFFDDVVPSPNHKATIKITAKDGTTGTSTDVATVVITWQGSNFSLSTGLLLSTLPNRTYMNGPVYVNGAPSKDGNGNTIYAVTELDTRPSFVTPLALVNYELPFFYSKSGRFGTDLSGGLGANLTTKSADYAAGVSIRYRDLLFSPMLHYGRETFLSGGITVGDHGLGSTTTIPTEQHFRPNFGFAITYRTPIP